jgi:hypothetical protein
MDRKNGHEGRYIVRPVPQQVGIARWAVLGAVPALEKQRAFEQEARRVLRDREPVQEPLQTVACQDKVEVLLRNVCALLQPRSDGSRAVGGHAVIASM